MTIDDYSPLFALFVLFAIRYSRLFAVRYSRLFAVRYSLFATIRYSLFGFSRHPTPLEVWKCSPLKFCNFGVSEMPSPGFSVGHFQYIMQQKCSRKSFILTIFLMFTVSYSVTKIKIKNTKTMETGHKQRAGRLPLRWANSITKLSISTFLCLCM